ncbi:MAG: hypothetical protein IKW52_00560 [Alistipes sp.]|nr:hypothetical protein [Alistipes sp.]
MKKFLLVAVCFAMALSSCIKDETSASVDRIYDAYAQKLAAEAALTNAEAEALKLISEAEAALKAAEAEAMKIQNQILDIERQLAEVELEYAKAELEVKLAELEAQLVALEATMEKAAVEAEAALLEAMAALNKAQEEFIASVESLEAVEAARLVGLFNAYTEAVEKLIEAKAAVTAKKAQLVAVETELVDAEEYRDEVIAEIDEEIEECKRAIAIFERAIEIVKKYQGATVAEIEAALVELELEGLDLRKAAEATSEEANALADALEFLYPEVHPFYEFLFENPLGLYEVEVIDGTPWYGYAVLNDDPLTASKEYDFVPLYTCYYAEVFNEMTYEYEYYFYPVYSEEVVLVEKTYEDQVFAWEYNEAVSLGAYNAENIAKYAEYLVENLADFVEMIEGLKATAAEYEAALPYFKGAAEKALAWAEAEEIYNALYVDVTYESNGYDMQWNPIYTTYGKYLAAKMAYEGGFTVHPMTGMEIPVEGAKQVEEAAKAAKDEADAAEAEAKAAYEAAKKAAEAADATEEQKAAAAEAEKAYNEAKRAAEYANDDYVIAQAKTKEAKAAYEAAEKEYKAVLAQVEPAAEAVEAAKHAYDVYYKQYCTDLGFTQYYNEVTGADTYYYVSNQYESWLDYTAGAYADVAMYEAQYEQLLAVDAEAIAEFLATAEELSADEAEYLAAFNAAYKAAAEAALDQEIAWFKYDLSYEAYNALYETVGDAELVEEELEYYAEEIEDYNEEIKDLEARKVSAADLATYEDAIEFAKMNLEAAEAAVEFYSARLEAAEAAWKDAE